MASSNPSIYILIIINIIIIFFFSCVSSTNVPCPPKTNPIPTTPTKAAKCPRDTLKFGVCGDWLGLVHEVIGTKPDPKCCVLVEGLADVEAALCLCTAIKANVLGIVKVKIPLAISLVVNSCGKKVPEGFVCE